MKKSLILCLVLLLLICSAAYAYDETYEKAIKYFKSRDYRRAIPYLENYVVQKPDPAAYYMLGYAFYQIRSFDRSKDYFDQAYLIDPEFSLDKIPAHAGLSRQEEGLVQEVLELSGARKQMESYSDILSSTLSRFRARLGLEKQLDETVFFLRDSYKINRIYPLVVSTFTARFNKKYMIAVLQWLKSPLGRKSTDLEVAANMQGRLDKSPAYREEYERMNEGRRQLIRDMEKAVRATELNVDMLAVSIFEMLKGMQTGMQGSWKMTSEEIAAVVGKVRGVSRDQLNMDVLASLAYTYSGLSDEELFEVVAFYQSQEGRWFNDTNIEAVSFAISKASREVGEKMGSAFFMNKVML